MNSQTAYDYGFRVYNPGIGKFLSVDPLTKDYSWYTPYQFAGNNPIKYIDLDGLEPADPGTKDKEYKIAPNKSDSNKNYGYSWDHKSKQWVQGKITEYVRGDLKGRDGDLSRKPIPGVESDDESESSAKSDFINSFKAGTKFEFTDEENNLLNHFLNGNGSPIAFDPKSDIAKILSVNLTQFYKNYSNAALDYFKSNGNLDDFDGTGTMSKTQPSYMSANLFSATVMGGYQQMTVKITSIDIYSITLQVTIGDIFGAGKGDANSYLPGLSDLYNLQHNYSSGNKYNPFTWTVEFPITFIKRPPPTTTQRTKPQITRNGTSF